MNDAEVLLDRCSPKNFARNKSVPCEKLVYEDYNSIVAEVSCVLSFYLINLKLIENWMI